MFFHNIEKFMFEIEKKKTKISQPNRFSYYEVEFRHFFQPIEMDF